MAESIAGLLIKHTEDGIIHAEVNKMSEIRKNEVSTITDHGSINYASDVIAVIAGLAANEVAGIAGMSGQQLC